MVSRFSCVSMRVARSVWASVRSSASDRSGQTIAASHQGAPVIRTADLGRVVWLAKADASNALRETEFAFPRTGRGARVMADPAALRGGLAKLMSLSADSMSNRPHRRMGLRISSAPGRVVLELRDEGPGLSVRDLAAMYGSDGPGLSEARRRIERAGGVINVSSHTGAGTVYIIEFPVAG